MNERSSPDDDDIEEFDGTIVLDDDVPVSDPAPAKHNARLAPVLPAKSDPFSQTLIGESLDDAKIEDGADVAAAFKAIRARFGGVGPSRSGVESKPTPASPVVEQPQARVTTTASTQTLEATMMLDEEPTPRPLPNPQSFASTMILSARPEMRFPPPSVDTPAVPAPVALTPVAPAVHAPAALAPVASVPIAAIAEPVPAPPVVASGKDFDEFDRQVARAMDRIAGLARLVPPSKAVAKT